MRKTKIVCSMGPTTADDEVVRKLILAGMNVARFNFSHGDHASHKTAMDRVKRVSAELGVPVAILLDTKGPEIRTGVVASDGTITLKPGDKVTVTVDGSECTPAADGRPAHISLSWKELPSKVKAGNRILIADGLVELGVESVKGSEVLCTARNSGTFGSRKNVNLIGLNAGLPIMADVDRSDIAFGVEQDIDFVAASFVSYPSEVREIREYLQSLGSKAHIIAKIENEEGLDNIDGIIEEADGVMVARGDLGVQLPTERIPLAQKNIIAKCRKAGKPVITATQMLDSMIVNPRPTRAELTDVANAIFDGTDALMLSGETANGKYPVEAVETMARIAQAVEDSDEYCNKMLEVDRTYTSGRTVAQVTARNGYLLATDVKAMAIVTPTLTGNTARMVSQFRPAQTIVAVTPDPQVQRQLLLNWGVAPMRAPVAEDSEQMTQNSIKCALDAGCVHQSERIVMVAGLPLGTPLMINTVKVLMVGNVLARGDNCGYADAAFKRASGRIVRCASASEARTFLIQKAGEIMVVDRITDDYIPIMRLVNGIISEGGSDLDTKILSLVNPHLVWLQNVSGALKSLEPGMSVTIDGEQSLVYEGII